MLIAGVVVTHMESSELGGLAAERTDYVVLDLLMD